MYIILIKFDVPVPREGTYFEAAVCIAGADARRVPRAVRVQQCWKDQAILVRARLGTIQQCDAGVPQGTRAVPLGDSAWMCPWEAQVLQNPSCTQAPHPCRNPFHAWTPAELRSGLAGGAAVRPVTMFGCF